MIIRHERGKAEKSTKKRIQPVERKFSDADLEWKSGDTDFRVYVIDAHEFYDPMTSTKGRHMMHGPSVIVNEQRHGDSRTVEYFVNDPIVWNWIGRTIREGYLNDESILSPSDERNVKAAQTAGE